MPAYRVLIVDDQRDVRRMLRAALETLGVETKVTDVPSGEEAILVISRQPVDLLISDVRLPGISGLELKERAEIRNPNLRMILITGVEDPKTRREVANAGVDAYFFKPIEIGPFLDTVQRFIACEEESAEPTVEVVQKQAEPADASQVPTPPFTPVSQDRSPSPNLAQRLTSLRQELKAVCSLLIDERGQVIAQAGDLPSELPPDGLLAQLGAVFGAATRLSLILGTNLPRDLLYLPGRSFDLFMTHIGQNVGLLLVTPNGAWQEEKIGQLLLSTRQAARDLLEMLATWGVSLAGEESERTAAPALESQVSEAELSAELPDLEDIFAKLPPEQLKSVDVNAFWDMAASELQENSQRADAISYEQARQLGLAPDEN